MALVTLSPLNLVGRRRSGLLLAAALAMFTALASRAVGAAIAFDLPEDRAERSLKRFSEQSGREVLFASGVTRGVRTNRVQGEMPPADALLRMLLNTGLIATSDHSGGAFSVRRIYAEESKNGQRAAPAAGVRPAN